MPRRNPEDIDLGAIKTGVPDRAGHAVPQGAALKPIYAIVGAASIVIGWIELFWRHCL
jgi:hypothetical protein